MDKEDKDILIVIIFIGSLMFLVVGFLVVGITIFYGIDYNNEAHFVDFKCEGMFHDKVCTAEIMSIGDIRVR